MPPRARFIKCDESEEHILRRLGGAVVVQWDNLPKEVRDLLVEQATFVEDRHVTVQLQQQIKAFIKDHKDD